ncbi:MAG: PGF-CTERM-anchored ABC transporter substrate-binding protein [Salinigranum sp.]
MRTHYVTLLAAMLLATAAAGPVAASAGVHSQPVDASACGFPFTARDATGARVTVQHPPDRVVTLSPSAAQTMWEIGGKEKVVGVTQYATYLDGADSRANVSGAGDTFVNEERVIDLEPDLVLAPNTIPNDTVRKLRGDGLAVYRYRPATSVTDIENQTLLTGRLTGECSGARRTVSEMRTRMETVRSAVRGRDRPRVLYTFFGYTAGKGTFVDRIITLAGGDNVAADAGITGYKKISREVVVQRNPEWIVLNGDGPTVPKNAAYNSTDAVKQGHVVVLDGNYISEPAPRVIRPITKLARALHPDAFTSGSATNATANATGPASSGAAGGVSSAGGSAGTATEGGSEPGTARTAGATADASGQTAGDSATATGANGTATTGPGFGLAGALVGLLCASLVVSIRRDVR